jgi:hypothetical protein
MLARCIGLLFGLWGLDDVFARDLFDDDADTLLSRRG